MSTISPGVTYSEQHETQAHRQGHLLLALGNPEVRGLIADDLRFHGHLVTELADGEALQRQINGTARRPRPDLVVVDIELPGCSGLDLLTEQRGRGVATPFLLLSRQGRSKLIRQARRFEQVAVLETPFDLDELVAEVASLLDGGP